MARQYLQGFFTPKNPSKYKGDVKNIVFRSSYELKALKWCDMNPSIIEYSSEETIVPYFNELDGKMHRYFVDLLVKIKTNSGIKTFLVEIKPASQVAKPNPPQRKTKKSQMTYMNEVDTWICNQQKWKAASAFSEKRGWEFKILTEKELGIA